MTAPVQIPDQDISPPLCRVGVVFEHVRTPVRATHSLPVGHCYDISRLSAWGQYLRLSPMNVKP